LQKLRISGLDEELDCIDFVEKMIQKIKENPNQASLKPLTLTLTTRIDVKTVIRSIKIVEKETSLSKKFILKFADVKEDAKLF